MWGNHYLTNEVLSLVVHADMQVAILQRKILTAFT